MPLLLSIMLLFCNSDCSCLAKIDSVNHCPDVTNLNELTNELLNSTVDHTVHVCLCSQDHTSGAILGPKGGCWDYMWTTVYHMFQDSKKPEPWGFAPKV